MLATDQLFDSYAGRDKSDPSATSSPSGLSSVGTWVWTDHSLSLQRKDTFHPWFPGNSTQSLEPLFAVSAGDNANQGLAKCFLALLV